MSQSNHPMARAHRVTRSQRLTGDLRYGDLFADNLRRCFADPKLGAAVPAPRHMARIGRHMGTLLPPTGAHVKTADKPKVPRPKHWGEFEAYRRRQAAKRGRPLA